MLKVQAPVILLLITIFMFYLSAREQVKVVGSSTIFPFSCSVAEEFSARENYPSPVVTSTGSGGGIKLFCKNNDLNSPDIVNASRRMSKQEYDMCQKNGVSYITEALIGFDGIVLAQNKSNEAFNITKKELFLAIAHEVPSKDGKKLIKNPYNRWNQINPTLQDREIIIYGPPPSSGTRDVLEETLIRSTIKKFPLYKKLDYSHYSKIRKDGRYISLGENDNIIVQNLAKNTRAFGMLGYSFLVKNSDRLSSASINGVSPTLETISLSKYPISRALYLYINNSHSKKIKSLDPYISFFVSDPIIAENSMLEDIGLIHLPKPLRLITQENVLNKKRLLRKELDR